ncbi:MAG: hybrid sensor histidine kinase/response regulator [Thermodesulfobacteriota bacterium]
MKDKNETKAQLIEELETLRERNRQLEAREDRRAQGMARLQWVSRAAEQSIEGIAIVDLEGNLLFLNSAFANMHGYDPEELIGKNLSIFHTPEQMPSVDAANRETRETGRFSGEIWHARRDRTVFPTWMENSLFRNPEGNPIGMIGTLADITELKQTEQALRESEQKFRAIFDQTYQFIGLMDPDGILLEANRTALDFLGLEEDDVLNKPFWETAWWSHSAELQERVRDAVHRGRTGEFVRFEAYHPDLYGNTRYLDFSLRPVKDSAGKVVLLIPEGRDISDYKQSEAALKESEKKYRNLVDNALVGIFRRDLEGDNYYVNQALIQMLEYDSIEELRAVRFQDAYEDPKDRQRCVEALKEKGTVVGYELRLLTKTGKTKIVLANGVLEDGILSGMMMDITERKAMEDALRENEERHRALFEGSLDAIILADPESGQVIDANPAASELFRRPRREIIGLHHTELYPVRLRQEVPEAFARIVNDRDQDEPTETTILCPDGTERPVEVTAHIIQIDGRLVVYEEFRDIWVRKRMEQELGNIQRLQSLGVLAGGIAHDFNNILTAILANVSMARLYGEFDDEISQMLADAEKASLRAQGLTQQLLTFARGGEPIKKTVRISAFLRESAAFALSGSNTRCEYLMPDDIRRVEADEGQLIQVFQNLVINADQAMPEGGVVKIRAENVRIKENERGALKEGDHVKISVEDQGSGIPEEQLPKIFDPFFTTKERGRGLGLAIAFSIVNRHCGHMEVESALGKGTAVHVYLPASESSAEPGEGARDEPCRGEGSVLVVDDEGMVRRSVGEMLRRLGYEVGSARDGREGIELYEKAMEEGRPFDAVVMDLTIPGELGGKKTVGRLRELDPDAKVIVSSGYSDDPVMSRFREYGFDGVLVKPYKVADLAEVVRNVLLER